MSEGNGEMDSEFNRGDVDDTWLQAHPPQTSGHRDETERRASAATLLGAIDSGDPLSVAEFLSALTPFERQTALTEVCRTASSPPGAMLPIFHAAYSGNVDVFVAVHLALMDNLPRDTVVVMLTSTRSFRGRNLLATAVESGNADIIRTLVGIVDGHKLGTKQRAHMLARDYSNGHTALMVAAETGQEDIVDAVVKFMDETWGPSDHERVSTVMAKDARGWTGLTFAVSTGRTGLVDTIVALIERTVTAEEIIPGIEDAVPIAVSEILGSANDTAEAAALDVLACLLKYGTCLTSKQISSVGSGVGFEPLRKCLLDAVCLATNPLLVGMTLSLQLEDAAGCGREGQRQMASRLQKEVEDLVLEVFERLPQTVDGFQNGDTLGEGMKACSMIFAPETIHEHDQSGIFHEDGGGGHRVKMGPLKIALQARHQLELFCTQPLVVDFMSRKFSSLPPVGATEAEMKDAEEVRRQRRDRLSVQEHPEGNVLEWSREMLSLAAGPHPTFGSLTVLPGAQFIIAELVARPAFCYSIPAIRMAMYLMAYVAMLAVFGFEVLAGHGTVEAGEVIFFIYVLGAILIELMELWDDRAAYTRDHWNILDVLALAFCGAAFVVRVQDPENLWGRALYAAGAPLLLCRVLFFAQFLPAQGPMIEMVFNLAGELARFCTIMMVVMTGFAVSFFTLFRHSCTVDSFRTYADTFISLLRAMLGETSLFDDFTVSVECCNDYATPSDELHCEDFLMECCHNVGDEHFNGVVGKALLVAYLTVMGIILLNLLIAVLSEAYVDVKEQLEVETRVSRTLVIQHYVDAVEDDMLPSPLNLVQYAFALVALLVGFCMNRTGLVRRAEFYSGLALFWLTSGLFAVSVGSALWILSWPKALLVLWQQRSNIGTSRIPFTTQAAVLLCGIAMPLYLAYKWLVSATIGALLRNLRERWHGGGTEYSVISGGRQQDDGIIARALQLGPGALSVHQLREYLANPMDDPVVQRDEETRETTVEHLKLLRDHLDTTFEKRVGEIDSLAEGRFEKLQTFVEERVKAVVDERVSSLSDKVDAKLNEILVMLKAAEG